ncbi:MAG: DUF3784 domain-containing protein [Acutalibacteraceae bacterium]
MANTVGAILLGILALICFVLGYMQLTQKGILLNNAYLYASEQERQKMNKKPYYRQSGTIFILIGIIFVLNAIEIKLRTGWLIWLVIGVVIIILNYAIVSTVKIEQKNK